MFGNDYPEATQNQAGLMNAKVAQDPNLKAKLEWAVERAKQQLADAERARDILNKNPELEELINIMQRQRYL